MTQTIRTPRTPRVVDSASRAAAEEMLRDIAFVLSMTRKVREEIASDVPARIINRMNPVSVAPPWVEALV